MLLGRLGLWVSEMEILLPPRYCNINMHFRAPEGKDLYWRDTVTTALILYKNIHYTVHLVMHLQNVKAIVVV